MMHPLAEDFSKLKDAEIESRIQDLNSKYWQTTNSSIQRQLTMFLDMYRAEIQDRRAKQWNQMYQKRNKDLDNLINVS
jgi:hypothetical protein